MTLYHAHSLHRRVHLQDYGPVNPDTASTLQVTIPTHVSSVLTQRIAVLRPNNEIFKKRILEADKKACVDWEDIVFGLMQHAEKQ